MQLLNQYGVLEYLEECYEPLHTQSAQWIMEENDRVYACFALYEGGVMNKQNLLAELRTYDLVDQYLFHTEPTLKALTFVKAKEILL